MQGTEDRIVLYDHSVTANKLIPHAELLPIKGAAHDLLLDETYRGKVYEALVKFFNEGA